MVDPLLVKSKMTRTRRPNWKLFNCYISTPDCPFCWNLARWWNMGLVVKAEDDGWDGRP